MRTTISYMLMTCCLAAAFCTMAFGTADSWKELYAKVGNGSRKAHASEQTRIAPRIVVTKSSAAITQASSTPAPAAESAISSNVIPSVRQIPAGATRQHVVAMLGQPSTVDNDRWFYGSHAVIFKDDRVAGSVEADLGRAMRKLETQIEKIRSHVGTPAAKKSAKSNRKSYNTKTSKPRGYRRSNSPTLWEPMFRKFYSDTPLPRSQRHFSRYNGMPGYRDHRYTESNSIYRRR